MSEDLAEALDRKAYDQGQKLALAIIAENDELIRYRQGMRNAYQIAAVMAREECLMTNERKNITQPADWWEAWKEAADAEGLSLSDWIGRQCNAALGKKARKLSKRAPAHRPKNSPKKD